MSDDKLFLYSLAIGASAAFGLLGYVSGNFPSFAVESGVCICLIGWYGARVVELLIGVEKK